MRNTTHIVCSVKGMLWSLYRYLKGGEPVPAALDLMAEFLSGRDDLPFNDWVSEATRDSYVNSEVAGFAYDFFVGCEIPFGKVRGSDRLRNDLHFDEALQDDWDEYLADEFRGRFQEHLSFSAAPRIESIADLLRFLQRTIDRRGVDTGEQ